jgi:hypothetical protein
VAVGSEVGVSVGVGVGVSVGVGVWVAVIVAVAVAVGVNDGLKRARAGRGPDELFAYTTQSFPNIAQNIIPEHIATTKITIAIHFGYILDQRWCSVIRDLGGILFFCVDCLM